MARDKTRIKDIAERAGVSVGTADRVLHNRPNVSKKSLEKVQKALDEMDYRPNMYASALAYNKEYTFYCVIPKHESEAYWEEVEEGALAACERRSDFGLSMKMMYYNRFSVDTFTRIMNECLKQAPDGVIIVPSRLDVTRRFTDQLHEFGRTLHPARLLHARPETSVILRTGLFFLWLFCCPHADDAGT